MAAAAAAAPVTQVVHNLATLPSSVTSGIISKTFNATLPEDMQDIQDIETLAPPTFDAAEGLYHHLFHSYCCSDTLLANIPSIGAAAAAAPVTQAVHDVRNLATLPSSVTSGDISKTFSAALPEDVQDIQDAGAPAPTFNNPAEGSNGVFIVPSIHLTVQQGLSLLFAHAAVLTLLLESVISNISGICNLGATVPITQPNPAAGITSGDATNTFNTIPPGAIIQAIQETPVPPIFDSTQGSSDVDLANEASKKQGKAFWCADC